MADIPAEKKHTILVINGSASTNSSNHRLIQYIEELTKEYFILITVDNLKDLPHFDPELSSNNTPPIILNLREQIQHSDGILICTPEYIFSIPSGLKNLIEWCVSTTVFENKPTGLITASANGKMGHDELQLIMKTVMTRFTDETLLLIQGIKGKINAQGEITDPGTRNALIAFAGNLKKLVTGND